MFSSPWSRREFTYLLSLVLSILMLVLFTFPGFAQTTVGTGSIVGTIVDPSGAVVNGAKIATTNVATGQVINQTTNSAGAYNSGPAAAPTQPAHRRPSVISGRLPRRAGDAVLARRA